MRKTKIAFILLLLIVLNFHFFSAPPVKIYINGKVFTGVNDELNESVVIKGGMILYTGENDIALKFRAGKKSEVIDLKGKNVIPGFHDGYLNIPIGTALIDHNMNFGGLDLDSILHRLKIEKKNQKKDEPVYGFNFEHLLLNKQKWPTRYDLDKISENSPVIVYSSDGNNAWVNSAVLKQCGITKNTSEISGGRIVRFVDNDPTGIICGNSLALLKHFSFEAGLKKIELNRGKIESVIKYANKLGITSVTTIGNLNFVNDLREIESEGNLNLRFNIILPAKNIGRYLIKKIVFNSGTPFIRIISVTKKIDGDLYTSDAAMFSKYTINNRYGFLRTNKNDLSDLVTLFKKNNILGDFGAEGDRAVHTILNSIRATSRRNSNNFKRSRISNFVFAIDEDILRMKQYSVVPVIRPAAFIAGFGNIERLLGQRKSGNAFRARTLTKSGVTFAFGSGWPAGFLDPLKGIMFSVFRIVIGKNGERNEWFLEERLSIIEALRAYTYTPSYSVFDEKRTGAIEKGKFADMVILEGDIFSEKLSPEKFFSDIKVDETIIGGKTVYKREESI